MSMQPRQDLSQATRPAASQQNVPRRVMTPLAGIGRPVSKETMRWVGEVLSETHAAQPSSVVQVRVLREGVKKLSVAELSGGGQLVLKQYADERGAWTKRWLDRLAAAGFAPPERLAITPTRGWSATHRTLVTDLAGEHPWTSWVTVACADRDAAAVAAADWLVALQSAAVTLPDRTEYRAGRELDRHCCELGLSFPDYTDVLQRVGRTAHGWLYGPHRSGASPLVASHGDLHPNNLHIADDDRLSVTAIDVDTAGLRRPAYDVGYAIAQLLIVSWMRTGSFHAGAGAGQAFLHRWTLGGAPDADSVGAEVVRALLQSLHFELITYRTGRTELLDHWLHVSHSMLTAGVDDTLHTFARSPGLPS